MSVSTLTEKKPQKQKEFLVVKRGEIYFADIGEGIGSEQSGVRPCIILQNDIGNRYSPTTIVALITSINKKINLPVHYPIPRKISKLPQDSIILLEQIRTIDKQRLLQKISQVDERTLDEIDARLKISLGLFPHT